MDRCLRIIVFMVLVAIGIGTSPSIGQEPNSGTMVLDGLSYISFADRRVIAIPLGSSIRFDFGSPRADGSIPFTVQPDGVLIEPIPLEGRYQEIRYSLASTAAGMMTPTDEGYKVEFTGAVRAILVRDDGEGSFSYNMRFSTETASAASADGTEQVSIEGRRMVPVVGYLRLVGATLNRDQAYPEAGAPVYAMLSGLIDYLP